MLPLVARGAPTTRAEEGGENSFELPHEVTIYNSGDEVGPNHGGRDVRFVIICVI
jgi:hypothetical protein